MARKAHSTVVFPTVKQYEQLERDKADLLAFVESVAGGDCYAYEKTLHPRICGTCETCQARALLARMEKGA